MKSKSLINGINNYHKYMKNYHFPIIIEQDEYGYYIVSCPLFKGCHTFGETIEEALGYIKEVIELCLEETKIEELNTFIGIRDLEVIQDG